MNASLPPLNIAKPARFTVDEFLRLNETGVFDKYSKTELIEGEIICMNAQYASHARMKSRLNTELAMALVSIKSELEPIIEVSTKLSEMSLPEPDIVLTNYRGSGVVPLESVALIVEVSDSTLKYDLGPKAKLYAQHTISEYWVVDVQRACLMIKAHPINAATTIANRIKLVVNSANHQTIMPIAVRTPNMRTINLVFPFGSFRLAKKTLRKMRRNTPPEIVAMIVKMPEKSLAAAGVAAQSIAKATIRENFKGLRVTASISYTPIV
jgi:Uma2 family endonuclease